MGPNVKSCEDYIVSSLEIAFAASAVVGKKGGTTYLNQCRLFKVDPSATWDPGSGTEIIPGKHSDTRIKPLPLTNGHGRYITVGQRQRFYSGVRMFTGNYLPM